MQFKEVIEMSKNDNDTKAVNFICIKQSNKFSDHPEDRLVIDIRLGLVKQIKEDYERLALQESDNYTIQGIYRYIHDLFEELLFRYEARDEICKDLIKIHE